MRTHMSRTYIMVLCHRRNTAILTDALTCGHVIVAVIGQYIMGRGLMDQSITRVYV